MYNRQDTESSWVLANEQGRKVWPMGTVELDFKKNEMICREIDETENHHIK